MSGIRAIGDKCHLPSKPLNMRGQSRIHARKSYHQSGIQSLHIYRPFSTGPYHGRWAKHFLVGRHEDRLTKFSRTLSAFELPTAANIAITLRSPRCHLGFVGARSITAAPMR